MVKYRYKAKNNDGKVIRGVFYVDNEDDLRDILANQGYFLVKGHKTGAGSGSGAFLRSSRSSALRSALFICASRMLDTI